MCAIQIILSKLLTEVPSVFKQLKDNYKLIIGLVFVLFFAGNIEAQKVLINKDWQFTKGDLGGPWEAIKQPFNGTIMWQDVDLPHCYNKKDATNPYVKYYQGPAWYRQKIDAATFGDDNVTIHFEGVGHKSKVFINQVFVGEHIGGYDEWSVDITKALKDESKRLGKTQHYLIVRADNSRDLQMIPSDMSDFNLYGGIYRNVWMYIGEQNKLRNIKITPKLIDGFKKGNVKIELGDVQVLNDEVVKVKIKDSKGKVVANQVFEAGNDEIEIHIKKPRLWSPESPALYQAELSLSKGTKQYNTNIKFGFRSFEFTEKGPFILNGKRLLLRGTHRHEDHSGYGAVMPDSLVRKEMQMIKDMGCNFIRLGHYQQSELVLSLCDSLGLLVWEEIPWCRGGLGGEEYKRQSKRMLRNMIHQHYNHPSVILWGLGNENDWPGDFEEFDKAKIKSFMKELHDLSHQLDDSRLTAIRRCSFCSDVVDVYSPSIWAGWYRGKYTEYKNVSEQEMNKVSKFIHVEWGGSSHAYRHSENPDQGLEKIPVGGGADERNGDFLMQGGIARASKDGEWSESYICNVMDWHLKEQETMPWLTGTAQWIFKDYSTPLRPDNPIPYVNQKGLVQRDLTPKESYYVFQSYWSEKPMARIYGHGWPIRWGKEGETKLVKVYSNCDEAELFLNGTSMGKRKRDSQDFPAAGLRWNVKFKSGHNHIRVIAKKGKTVIEDEVTQWYEVRQWEAPQKIDLVKLDTKEAVWELEFEVKDKNGVVCLDSRDWIEYEYIGEGELIADEGLVKASRKVQLANGRAWARLKPGKGIIKVKLQNGVVILWQIYHDGTTKQL